MNGNHKHLFVSRFVAVIMMLTVLLSMYTGASASKIVFNNVSSYIDIGTNGYAWWENVSGNKLKIRFRVHNPSSSCTIIAFELYVYAENVWGEKIYGNKVYYATTEKRIAPGKTSKSDYMVIPKRSKIRTIYCAVKRVRYKDASGNKHTYEVSDSDLKYYVWNYK